MRLALLIAAVSVASAAATVVNRAGDAPPSQSDRIVANGAVAAIPLAVVADGPRAGQCVNDEFRTQVSPVSIDFDATIACPSTRLSVFQFDRAATEMESVRWSNDPDEIPVDLSKAPRQVPVVLRNLRGSVDFATKRAHSDLARAHQLFNTMSCGIVFPYGSFHDHSGSSLAKVTIDCPTLAKVASNPAFYTPMVVNAYYAEGYTSSANERGLTCDHDPFTIIIWKGADNETLAHELGHALSLRDIEFDDGNVMRKGALKRRRITTGQCYRANWNGTSIVNAGITRTASDVCDQPTVPDRCPAEQLGRAAVVPTETTAFPLPNDHVIAEWLLCDDCDGEVFNQVIRRPSVVVALEDVLMAALPADHEYHAAVCETLKMYANGRADVRLGTTDCNEYSNLYAPFIFAGIQAKAVAAVAAAGGPQATDLLKRFAARTSDSELRRRALEALNVLGRPR